MEFLSQFPYEEAPQIEWLGNLLNSGYSLDLEVGLDGARGDMEQPADGRVGLPAVPR
jgi:hypothetical protein